MYSIKVENNGGKNLQQCQVQLRILAKDELISDYRPPMMVCAPFSLRPGDHIDVDMLYAFFDGQEDLVWIERHYQQAGTWQKATKSPALTPGNYLITVRALSADTMPAQKTLRLECVGRSWRLVNTTS
jgi:hypothetical protein